MLWIRITPYTYTPCTHTYTHNAVCGTYSALYIIIAIVDDKESREIEKKGHWTQSGLNNSKIFD